MSAQLMRKFVAPAIVRNFTRRERLWRGRGISPGAATVLALEGIDTIEQMNDLGRKHFDSLYNVNFRILQELEEVSDWSPKIRSPTDAITRAFLLTFRDSETARELAMEAIFSLRRSGFVISTGGAK
jgi:hypothetical protein